MKTNNSILNSEVSRFYLEQNLEEEFKYIDTFESAVEKAVDLAYNDACRPLTNIGKYKDIKDIALVEVKKAIKEFKSPQEDFDTFHKKCCNAWCDQWPGNVKNQYGNYGTAQKIVNMSFKYLYCWESKCNKRITHDFSKCHMTIDGYTLNWIIRQDTLRRKKNDPLKGISKTNWSSLSQDQYLIIVGFISSLKESSDLLKENVVISKLSMFELEFLIWQEERVEALKVEFVSSLNNLKKYISDEEIQTILKNIE